MAMHSISDVNMNNASIARTMVHGMSQGLPVAAARPTEMRLMNMEVMMKATMAVPNFDAVLWSIGLSIASRHWSKIGGIERSVSFALSRSSRTYRARLSDGGNLLLHEVLFSHTRQTPDVPSLYVSGIKGATASAHSSPQISARVCCGQLMMG